MWDGRLGRFSAWWLFMGRQPGLRGSQTPARSTLSPCLLRGVTYSVPTARESIPREPSPCFQLSPLWGQYTGIPSACPLSSCAHVEGSEEVGISTCPCTGPTEPGEAWGLQVTASPEVIWGIQVSHGGTGFSAADLLRPLCTMSYAVAL